MKRIGVINYGTGNVGSVCSAFSFYKYEVRLIDEPRQIEEMNLLVLAGVGSFSTAAGYLKKFNFWDAIDKYTAREKRPLLGICLGMQLFAETSMEGGVTKGFGWIKGDVAKIDNRNIKVPHIGWSEVLSENNVLFNGMRSNFFYFMHSFHFRPEDDKVVVAKTNYNGFEIVSALRKDNIVGVQFHPEKSQGDGLRFLRNVVEELT